MTLPPCAQPLGLADLIAYERGELAEDDETRLEEHFFSCGYCARRLADLQRLHAGVAELARRGAVTSGATSALIAKAIDAGVGIRSYRLRPGETVPCTCAPGDDFVAVHLAADIAPNESVDMEVEARLVASGEVIPQRRTEVVVDRAAGEVIVLYAGDAIRQAPRSQWTMHLHSRTPGAERVLGPYVLDHTPWDELPHD